MFTDCFDDHVEDLAFDCDLSLPEARQVAHLGLNAIDPEAHTDAPAGLTNPEVSHAYFEAFFGAYPHEAPWMLDAQVRRALAAGHDNAGIRVAAAHVAEHRGDIDGWIDHLDAALRHDPSFSPARVDRGYAACLQGDLATAQRLLDGVDDTRAVVLTLALKLLEPAQIRVPRNQRCPCGSGLKSKHCCDGTIRLPGGQARFLWLKLHLWLQRYAQDVALDLVAAELADGGEYDDDDVYADVFGEGTTRSLALLECGLLDRFRSTFGPLLPDDDLALVDQWRGEGHRLWEVLGVGPDRTAELVDVVDRSVRHISDVGRTCCVAPGRFLYAAVLPSGDGWFMPDHLGLTAGAADIVAAGLRAGDRPMDIAIDAYDEVRDPPM